MAARNKILCVIFLSLFTWGMYDVLVNFERNYCSMTYMWENPVYLSVTGMKDEVRNAFPRYSLFLYGEGSYAERSRNMKLDGIPVLFIPGNAGSYKQVRSLGSVALRKAQRYTFHFNYFSVDLNGELVGMYGGFLHEQSEYVSHCIHHILSLYQHLRNPPKTVILVGHSIGGLVARSLYLLPNFNPTSVNTILTQATPHDSPVVKADQHLDDFQFEVNKFWNEQWNSSALNEVVLVSVGGGFRDNLVRSGLTSLANVFHPSRSLWVITSALPKVWLSTDHLCVVWCKELVLATKRAMFDMIDPKTKQVFADPAQRMKMLRQHLSNDQTHTTTKTLHFKATDTFHMVEHGSLHLDGVVTKESVHYLFPLLHDNVSSFDHFVAVGNIANPNWISACIKINDTVCIEAITLNSQLMPPRKTGWRKSHVSVEGLEDASHLVMKIPKSEKVFVSAELYNSADYAVHVVLPGLLSYVPQIVFNETREGSSFHRVYLDDLYTPSVAYKASLDVISCDSSVEKGMNSTLHFHVPWSPEDSYSVRPAEENNVISLKLISGRNSDDERKSELFVHIHPKCQYRLSIMFSHQETFGQLVRFHSTCLPCFITIVIILVLSYQLKQLRLNEPLHDFIWIQSSFCKPFVVVPFVSLIRVVIRWEPLTNTYDITAMERKNIFFGTLPIVMFLFSYSVVCVTAQLLLYITKSIGLMYSLLSRTPISDPTKRDGLQAAIPWMLYTTVGVIIAIASSVSGALATVLAFCLSIAHVSKRYANVIYLRNCMNLTNDSKPIGISNNENTEVKEDIDDPVKENDEANDVKKETVEKKERIVTPLDMAEDIYNYHFTLLMLLLVLVILNMTSLIVWAQHLRYNHTLSIDPTMYTSMAVCATLAILLDSRQTLPTNMAFAKLASGVVYAFTILMVLYTIESIYRLPYFISATFLIAAAIQI